MKKLFISAVILSAFFAVVSCSKSFDPKDSESSEETKVFTATIENNVTKTVLNGNNIEWQNTDEIAIIGNNGNGSCGVYTATPKSPATQASFTFAQGTDVVTPNYVAYYPSSLCWNGNYRTNPTLPATQNYKAGNDLSQVSPMYAYSTTKSLSFKNLCGILAIKVLGNKTVNKIVVTSNQVMNGKFTAVDDGNGYKAQMSKTTNITLADRRVILECNNNSATDATYYIAIPPQAYTSFVIQLVTPAGNEYMPLKVDPTIERNKKYAVTFDKRQSDDGKQFSVSGTKKVKFSPGNLVWNGSNFYFESAQYKFRDSWSEWGDVGHFYWTDTPEKAAAENYSKGSYFFADINHKLTVYHDYYSTSGWYALSKDEWSYLINSRENASSLYKNEVTCVESYNCLILAPDGYTGSIQDSYNEHSWSEAEAQGLVCIPKAGHRQGNDVFFYNFLYWLATFSHSGYNMDYAYDFSNGGKVYELECNIGMPVRLVRDVN